MNNLSTAQGRAVVPPAGRPTTTIRAAVAGATGYAGHELVRWLVRHPSVNLGAVCSGSSHPGRTLPDLARIWDGVLRPPEPATLARDHDVVFLALPDEAAARLTPDLVARGVRVIDLSGAHRLRDEAARARWYPATNPVTAREAVYGLPEHYGGSFPDARLIACAGCYPTAALLALKPLTRAGLLASHIVVDAKSGISGAGRTPSERTHFSECQGNVAAYGVFSHRHSAELEQEAGQDVTFVPHLVPLDRGILVTIYASLRPGVDEELVGRTLDSQYAGAPFVRLRGSALPEIKHVVQTNFCDIGWVVDPGSRRIVVVACLDNLVKGAAGQAIQSMNLACGFDERAGLWP